MAVISLEKAALSAALSIGGAGAIMIWPTKSWIGVALLVCAGLIVLYDLKWKGVPWWQAIPKPKNPFRRLGCLYVGRMVVADSELDQKGFLDLTVVVFNATRLSFQNTLIEGHVDLGYCSAKGGSVTGGGELQAPVLYFESGKPHRPFSEFMIGTRLFLQAQQVVEFRSREAAGDNAQLSFSNLTLSVETKRGKRMRVHLWDGVSVRNGVVIGRIVSVTAHATARVSASLG